MNLKKVLKSIESKRMSKSSFWKISIFIKDFIWRMYEKGRELFINIYVIVCFPFLYMMFLLTKEKKTPKMRTNIAAIVLSWKRPLNLPFVIYGLRKQSYIKDIYIYHNHPSRLKIPGCYNILSRTNEGCKIRHTFANTLKNYNYFVFIDDDLMIKKDLKHTILPVIQKHGKESIIGAFGKNLNLANKERPYTSGKDIEPTNKLQQVDITKGRFHIISKENIQKINNERITSNALDSEDDIKVNIIIQKQYHKPSYLLPVKNSFINLPNNNSREQRNNHKQLRDKAILDAIKGGWKHE